jgi:antitoxin component YwqK of YwqJK toxin-antitoxin module
MKNLTCSFQGINRLLRLSLPIITLYLLCSLQTLEAQIEKKELLTKGDSAFYKGIPYTGTVVKYARNKVTKNGNQTVIVEEKWLKEEDEYRNGILQRQTEYYPSQQKKVEMDYATRQYTGWYDITSGAEPQVRAKGPFTKSLIKKMKRQGEWIYYRQNGKIYCKSSYDNDKLNGKTAFYNEAGNLTEEGKYKNNEKDGSWTFYNEQGKRWYTIVYQKDQEVSRKTEKGMKPAPQKSTQNGDYLVELLTLPLNLLYGFK